MASESNQNKKNSLENVVNKTHSSLQKGLKFAGLAAAIACPPLLFAYGLDSIFPSIDEQDLLLKAAISGGGFGVGNIIAQKLEKKPVTFGGVAKDSLIGTILSPLAVGYYGGVEAVRISVSSYAGSLVGGVAALGIVASSSAFITGAYLGLNYLLSKRTTKGMYKNLKEDYWPTLKRSYKYVFPILAANVLFVGPYIGAIAGHSAAILSQLAVSAFSKFWFRVKGIGAKENEHKQPNTSHQENKKGLLSKIKSGIKGMYTGKPALHYA